MKLSRSRQYLITTQKVLSEEEQAHLIRICTRTENKDPLERNGLMFMVALECGLRASELLGLKIKDFDPRSHTVFIQSLKGSNARQLPLRTRRSMELARFVLESNNVENWNCLNNEQKIFRIGYQRLYQLWEFYRPNPQKKLHSLRHTFAINLYKRTKDIKAVQLALGHRNIENTLVYVDFIYNTEVLRKLMHG